MKIKMKKTLRKLLISVITLTLTLGSISFSFATTGAPPTTPAKQTQSSILVQYDGANISFTDAIPKIINGRTMVPFRQILENIGATVEYDVITKTVKATKGTKVVSFKIGSSDIQILDGLTTETKKMDVVPFVDAKNYRTYVSARFIAESFGYNVGWDSQAKTVIIVNFEQLFANADSDFSILNKLMSNNIDFEKTYHSTSSFDAAIKTYSSAKVIPYNISGSLDSIQSKASANIILGLKVDMSEYIASLPVDQRAEVQASLEMWKNISVKMKVDGEKGVAYINSPIASFLNQNVDENTWIKLMLTNTSSQDLSNLKSFFGSNRNDKSLAALLNEYAKTSTITDVKTYEDIKIAYLAMKNLIGDQAFTKNTAGGSDNYSLNINKEAVLEALAKAMIAEGKLTVPEDFAAMKQDLGTVNFNIDFALSLKQDMLDGYTIKGTGDFEGTTVGLNVYGDLANANMKLEVKREAVFEVLLNTKSSVIETTEALDLKLPTGAKVINYENL